GIASWRGLGVSFTDGMCRGCSIRFRQQWQLPGASSAVRLAGPPPALLGGALTVALVMILVLIVRSSDHGQLRATMTPPPETVLVPTPVESEPTSPAPPAPRRARLAASPRLPSAPSASIAKRRAAPDSGFSDADGDHEAIVFASLNEPVFRG